MTVVFRPELNEKPRKWSELVKEFDTAPQGARILEVSSRGEKKFSAMHRMTRFGFVVESLYQGSKVFENAGPFPELYDTDGFYAKRSPLLKGKGKLIGFDMNGLRWGLDDKPGFYDWLYITSLIDAELIDELSEWDGFTDMFFSPGKMHACQARSCAMAVSMAKWGWLDQFRELVEKDVAQMWPRNCS